MSTTVTNIYVNNQSGSDTVRIIGPHPTVTWSLIGTSLVTVSSPSLITVDSLPGERGEIQEADQFQFEIRIGTTSTNWGTNSFSGDIIATGLVESPTKSYTYNGDGLERSNTYYGQIRVKDDFGQLSSWVEFSFKYNSLPIAFDAQISPSQPRPLESLTVTYFYADEDSDPEGDTVIQWFRNGVHQKQLDNLTSVNGLYVNVNDEWAAQILPYDGYEYGTTVAAASIEVVSPLYLSEISLTLSDAKILPENANYDDVLYAFFNSTDKDVPVNIRWYVNGNLLSDFNESRILRTELLSGDEVYFQVFVSTAQSDGLLTSPPITIIVPPFKAHNLRVDGAREPLSLSAVDHVLTWDIFSPKNLHQQYVSVSVGTRPGASDVYDKIVQTGEQSFTVPSRHFEQGKDYYAQISVGADQENLSAPATCHFRISGLNFEQNASNSTGWTIELNVKINTVTNIDETTSYQGVRVSDGTKYLEVRLFTDHIEAISPASQSVTSDVSNYCTITICGKNDDFSVYRNGKRVINGTNMLTQTSVEKYLQIGAIGSISSSASYLDASYTTNGSFSPTSAEYNTLSFVKLADIPLSAVTAVTAISRNAYLAATPSGAGESSNIFKYVPTQRPSTFSTASKTYSPVSKIRSSDDGLYTYFMHANGTSLFTSYPILTFDEDLDLTADISPENYGWEEVSSVDTSNASSVNGFNIDVSEGGKWYYVKDQHGSKWFDTVKNSSGWTVDFTLTINSISNNTAAIAAGTTEGVGVYVCDGSRYETVNFLEDRISFSQSGVSTAFSTTRAVIYRLTGKGNRMRLYAKPKGKNDFKLLLQGTNDVRASTEGNARRPAVSQDSSGNLHAVWHDDGAGLTAIYYSKFRAGSWSFPKKIVNENFNAFNPSIACTSNNILVVFESRASGYSSIAAVIHNPYGWSDPFTMVSNGANAQNPRICADDLDNVHMVWEDYRNAIGDIYYSMQNNYDGSFTKPIIVSGGYDKSIHPSVDAQSNKVAVSWTRIVNGVSFINAASKNTYAESFDDPILVSDTDTRDADHSDVIIYGSDLFVVYHDDTDGNYQIYAYKGPSDLSGGGTLDILTNQSFNCRFPRISLAESFSQLVVVFQGSVVDDVDQPSLYTMLYTPGSDLWQSSAQGSYDCKIDPQDGRYIRNPSLSKRFTDAAYIIYEADLVDSFGEYMNISDTFSTVMSALYNMSFPMTYNLPDTYVTKDVKVSGTLPRKEIRFGAFSDVISANMSFENLKYYTKDAVQPFVINLVSSENSDINDDRTYDALVNPNGDAWIGTRFGPALYLRSTGQLAKFSSAQNTTLPPRIVRAFAISDGGVMFVGTDAGVYASIDHITFIPVTGTGVSTSTSVTDLAIDANDVLWIGALSGAYGLDLRGSLASLAEAATTIAAQSTVTLTLPSSHVNAITVGEGSIVWVSTNSGLVKYFSGIYQTFDSTNTNLLTNVINCVTIRNDNLRYLATSSGIYKMLGNTITKIIVDDESVLNNNVKSVLWNNPNILWASTLSDIVQVVVNDELNIYNTLIFPSRTYSLLAAGLNDLRTFYVVGSTSNIVYNAVAEVYVNGSRQFGGYQVATDFSCVRFDCPLLLGDVVQLIFRNDLLKYSSLNQISSEKDAEGLEVKNIRKMLASGNSIFASTDVNSSTSLFKHGIVDEYTNAFDRITLDTEPPTGSIKIIKQLSRYELLIDIEYVSDNISGVDTMIVSNNSNFTTDGITPQIPVPFTDSLVFTLSPTPASVAKSYDFEAADGTGNYILEFSNNLYAGTAQPATILTLDIVNNVWTSVTTLGTPTGQVDFMIVYNTSLIVSVGQTGGSVRLYKTTDGENFTLIDVLPTDHAYAGVVAGNILYLGGNNGMIYSYNGNTLTQKYNTGSSHVYSMATFNSILYAGTGEKGRLVQINLTTSEVGVVVADADDEIRSMLTQAVQSSAKTRNIFYGTGTSNDTSGRIMIRSTSGGTFQKSFQTVPAPVQQMTVEAAGTIATPLSRVYAAINKSLYLSTVSLTAFSSWSNTATLPDTINSFVRTNISPLELQGDTTTIVTSTNSTGQTITTSTPKIVTYAVTDSTIYLIDDAKAEKKVYLKLIDRAGNATTALDSGFFDSITLTQLKSFINENKLLIVDELGNETSFYQGASPFYSGKYVSIENGEYYSEIFFGTDNLLSWQTISWDASVPSNTALFVDVRSSDTRSELLTSDFIGNFNNNQSSGADISFISGKYIQFRVRMSSTDNAMSPTLRNVIIQSRSSFTTHFFTTNFVLPSKLKRGLITMNKIVPVAADIVVGINTTNSTEFADYQIIPTDKIFVIDDSQSGTNLRVGIKFITPTQSEKITDVFNEYGPYDTPLYTNVVDFTHSTPGTWNYKVSFYSDENMSKLIFSQYSADDIEGFVIDGAVIPSEGVTITTDEITINYVPVIDTSPLFCNTYYYVKIEANDGNAYTTLFEGHSFIQGCNVSFYDTIAFAFTNTSGSSHTYSFRIRAYTDALRTQLYKTYYSGTDSNGWTVNDTGLDTSGIAIANNAEANIAYTPTPNDFVINATYYLVIDSFDGTDFGNATPSLTFRISDVISAAYCGEYTNVPVVRNWTGVLELEGGELINLNL